MFKKITDNLLTSSIAALIVVLFLVGIGFAVGGGIVSPGTFTSGASQKGLVGQWRLNSDSEKVSANDIISSWNGAGTWPYETFTSSGLDITSAVETGAAGNAFQTFSTTVGKTYRVSFNLTLNSGSLPSIFSSDNQGGGSTPTRSLDKVATAGLNSFTYKAYATRTEYIQFYSGSASNFSISDFSLKEVQTADTTPYENNGTVYGADIRNHGYNFNGSSDYIDLTTQVLGEDHTVSFWATGGNDAAMLSSSNPWGNYIKYTNSWVIVYSVNNYNFYDYTMNFGTWYYITVVTIGDDVKVYIDGQELNKSIDNISGTGDSFEFRYIGARSDLTVFYDGSISDLKIYDSALTVSQIGDLYQGKQVGSPVLDMPLKSGPKDLSGNDNDGIVTGATLVGEAASFDGTDDYISITTDTLDDLPSDDFSVSAWAKFDVLGVNTEHRIFNKRQSAEGWFFEHTGYGGSGQISMFVDYTGTNANTKSSVGSVVVDTWYHLVGVFDSSLGSSKVYINGVEDSSSVVDGTGSLLSDATKDLLIGVDAVGGNNMDGYVSDARIYSRTLSDDEIEALYNNGSQSEQYISVGSDQKGLVGHWKLDQDGEKVGSEIITAQENRDFSSANNWANTNMNSFDTTSDLSLSGVGGQWSYLFHSYGPMTAGKRYRVIFDASSVTGTWQIRGYNSDFLIGTIASGANDITFTNIGAGGIRITNTAAGSIDLDNFSIKELQTKDSTPNSNNGIIQGPTYIADHKGQAEKAMYFDGTGEINLTAHLSDYNTLTEGTISFWGYELGANSAAFSIGTTLTSNNLVLIGPDTSNQLYVLIKDASGDVLRANSSTAKSAGWHHYAYSSDSSGNYFYIDGEVQSVTYTSGNSSTSAFFNDAYSATQNFMYLGLYTISAGSPHFTGNLSDVRIYNRVLSLKEIQDQYGSYNTELRTGSLTKGLVGSWDLKSKDEKVGSNSVDSWDFTSGWSTALTTIDDLNSFTSSAAGGVYKDYNLTVGKTYKYIIDGSTSATNFELKAGGSGSSLGFFGSTFTVDLDYTIATSSDDGLYLRNQSAGTTDITRMIVKEVQTKDSTPYSNHGDVYGTTASAEGMIFAGTNQYIQKDVQIVDSYPFTISTWFKMNTGEGGAIVWLSDKDSSIIYYGIHTDITTGKVQIWARNTTLYTAEATNAYNDNAWHQATAVYTSATDRKLYIDNVEVATSTNSVTYSSLVDRISIGVAGDATPTSYFVGSLAGLKIYNRALDISEIESLYNKGR